MLNITLKRSFIGTSPKHKKVLRALGFRKPNQIVIHNDVPSIRGMIAKVSHMVEVITGTEGQKMKKTESKKNRKTKKDNPPARQGGQAGQNAERSQAGVEA